MTLDTQMTLALLQELLLALRANYAEGFKGWLALGLEELGQQVVIELMQVLEHPMVVKLLLDWLDPFLTVKEQERLVGWPVIRRLLRHNALSAWETMQKSGGWKRCPPKW